MPTISYSGFGFRSDPRVNGCGGLQPPTVDSTDFGLIAGSQPPLFAPSLLANSEGRSVKSREGLEPPTRGL